MCQNPCVLAAVALKGVRESHKRQKESPSVGLRGSERTPYILNSFSEKSLGVAGSTPSPRLGQQLYEQTCK